MALNTAAVQQQVVRLSRQAASARCAADRLSVYRDALGAAWSAGETAQFTKTINDLIRRCEKLETQMTSLRSDILRAMEDILREEAENDDTPEE